MTLVEAIVYYVVRLVIFSAVAAGGIALGIKFRKRKNQKQQEASTEN